MGKKNRQAPQKKLRVENERQQTEASNCNNKRRNVLSCPPLFLCFPSLGMHVQHHVDAPSSPLIFSCDRGSRLLTTTAELTYATKHLTTHGHARDSVATHLAALRSAAHYQPLFPLQVKMIHPAPPLPPAKNARQLSTESGSLVRHVPLDYCAHIATIHTQRQQEAAFHDNRRRIVQNARQKPAPQKKQKKNKKKTSPSLHRDRSHH